MNKIANVFIKRPVFATMLILCLVVLGGISYFKLGKDLFPNVDLPNATITTTLKGASVEEMETSVTKPIEEAVNTISGIETLRSVTNEGVSRVIVEFSLDKDGDIAAQDVRDKVSTILNQLPEGTDPPVIEKFDVDASPVLQIAISGKRNMQELTDITDKMIKQNLETIGGVGQVILIGGSKRAINIILDVSKLEAYGLSVTQVKNALTTQNLELPGGRVDQGSRELVLRTMGRVETAARFSDIIIANKNGTPIYLRDVARVDNSVEEPRSLARLDGRNAVTLLVRKQSGTNTVATVEKIKARLIELKAILPSDIELLPIKDSSRFIVRSIHELQLHLILGALLVCITVFIFMRDWRSTVIVALSVPASLIATFTMMRAMGFTINNMTLLGLTLSVGVVIDDAIVVLENIFRHIEEKNQTPMQAAMDATSEIALAVMATTLSLVVIFMPIAFMSGTVGRFFQSYGFTVATAIMVSLVVAFTLIPSLAARFLRKKSEGLSGAAHTAKDSLLWRNIDGVYGSILRWSLNHRWAIIVISVLVVASVVPVGKAVGKDFIPQDDQSEFEVVIGTPEGYTLTETDKIFREVEARLAKLQGVDSLLTTIGDSSTSDVTSGTIYLKLKEIDERGRPRYYLFGPPPYSQMDVMAEARKIMSAYPDLRVSIQPVAMISSGSFRRTELNLNVRGPDLDKLNGYTTKIIAVLKNTKGITDIDTSLSNSKPEIRVNINREKASDQGVKVVDIAAALRTLVGGERVTKYKEGADQYDVWLRAEPKDRADKAVLARMSIPSEKGGLVRLGNLVDFKEQMGPSQIDRQDRQRQITVVANMEKGYPLGLGMDTATKAAVAQDMPVDYHFDFAGRGKIMIETFQNFGLAFVLSLILMYIILASQFESFLHPVTIMLAVPISIPFALVSLLILGESLNIYSIFGIFMLFGIVKKNGILQVDYTNTLINGGMERDAAILEANHTRLRPILMTTVTLIAGMIPIALGQGPGAASRAAMAKVIIGGQALCLLLTLLLTPVAYSLFDDIQRWRMWEFIKGLWRRKPVK